MAVSDTFCHKLLNAWQRQMFESIWHFNQVKGQGAPLKDGRNVYIQPNRDDLAMTLRQAVGLAADKLGFYPRPTWITDEIIPLGNGSPYQLQTLRARWKYVQAFGTRGTTVIQANAAVAYSDSDGDGVLDRATISVATAITDTSQIQVFFRTADGAPGAADERWEIEPLTVSVSGGAATITGHRALFVKPSTIWNIPFDYDGGNYAEKNYADTANAGDFVTQVDVYRVYPDATSAVQLVSDDWLTTCGCSSTSDTLTSAGARLVDKRLGIFQVRPSACGCTRPFESVKVSYLAGYPLENGRMNPTLEIALIRLANTLVSQTLCNLWDKRLNRFATDRQPMPQELMQQADLKNPFGITTGQVAAWHLISNMVIAGGSKL